MSALPTAREPRVSPLREGLKRHLAGRMLAAGWRRRKALPLAARAGQAERKDARAGRVPPAGARRREVSSVVFIPSGPGDPAGVLDTIDSALASDGDTSQILVIDDCSVDAREAVIRERFPQVEVVRTPLPSGGPPNVWPPHRLALEHALAHYDFDVFAKLDADAVATGPGFSERGRERLAAAPGAGVAGSFRVRADGREEGYRYHVAVLARELRYDRMLAEAVRRAEGNGWRRGDMVQGGTMYLSREACDVMKREGWLGWRRPWHSNTAEDLALTIFVRACGLEALSLGAPDDGVVAVANKGLPLTKEQLADGPWVAAHSVRTGLNGESEDEVRAFFRSQRASWPAVSPMRASA